MRLVLTTVSELEITYVLVLLLYTLLRESGLLFTIPVFPSNFFPPLNIFFLEILYERS